MDITTYEYQPSFILGFHGCDKEVGEALLSGQKSHLLPSEKAYDWLGHGIYFWEGNPSRALAWAKERHATGKIANPFVLGAIIDLRHCLDLFDQAALTEVQLAYRTLERSAELLAKPLPKNVGDTPDKAGRKLDCAVINLLHTLRKNQGHEAYASVRGPFLEGEPLYPGAGFRSQNHIQLCIRDTKCIKGYFRVIESEHPSPHNPSETYSPRV